MAEAGAATEAARRDMTDAVARSPITPPPPVLVQHGWEISGRRSTAALRIMDCTPMVKILVRAGPAGRLAAALDVPFGRARRDSHGVLVAGTGPGEWLLLGLPGSATAISTRLTAVPDEGLVSVLDETHGHALVRITGAAAAGPLAKLCPMDLSDEVIPAGAVFRGLVAGLAVEVIRDDHGGERSYLLACDRSFGQYLFDTLLDAGEEFGIDVDGFVPPGT